MTVDIVAPLSRSCPEEIYVMCLCALPDFGVLIYSNDWMKMLMELIEILMDLFHYVINLLFLSLEVIFHTGEILKSGAEKNFLQHHQ